VSPSTFYKTWKKSFPHVKIPKCERVGKCPKCLKFTGKINAARDPSEKEEIRNIKKKHVELAKNERGYMGYLEELARSDPKSLLYMQVDSMDTARPRCPISLYRARMTMSFLRHALLCFIFA
jgi:hypothetical protein